MDTKYKSLLRHLLAFAALACIAALFLNPIWAGDEKGPVPSGEPNLGADAAWASYKALKFNPDAVPHFEDVVDSTAWRTVNYRARAAAARWFYGRFPQDARRWQAAFDFMILRLKFIDDSTSDEKAEAFEFKKLLKDGTGVPLDLCERVWAIDADDAISQRLHIGYTKADLDAVRALIDAYELKFSTSELAGELEFQYVDALDQIDRPSAQTWIAHLLKSSNSSEVTMAQGWQRKYDLLSKPIEMAFTAVDGREVDLAKLRGKVVLVDFWATWCGPCKAEIPNVVATYNKYHEKGFEVVGVALESKTSDKQKLIDFVAAHGMAWPQYFDGKFWKTAVAVQYDIHGIPAMFLLGKDGRVISTDARGLKLEEIVKKQLGI